LTDTYIYVKRPVVQPSLEVSLSFVWCVREGLGEREKWLLFLSSLPFIALFLLGVACNMTS
jgi:hypothetical protein